MNTTTEAPATLLAWHFARDDNRLGFKDGRKIVKGKTLKVEGAIVPCERGLHGCVCAFDALQYAQGSRLWRVELGGTVVPHGNPVDKYAASERTALQGRNAEKLLRAFARQCAADVLHLWKAPAIVLAYLATGKESIRAAARDAAWAAAGAAAGDAAGDAARDAAWAAAGDAARAAAWAAAWAAAGAAARAAQAQRFEQWCVDFLKTGRIPQVVVPEVKP